MLPEDEFYEMYARLVALEAEVEDVRIKMEDEVGGDGGLDNGTDDAEDLIWSYKVSRLSGLSVAVTGGLRKVIHIDEEEWDADWVESGLTDNSINYFYIKYEYGVGWDNFTMSTSLPGQDVGYRLFHIATITTSDGKVDLIHHNHVGDLEVYDLNC